MGKFNEYSQKATPADNDTLMIYDATSKANKLSPFSGIWNWIVGKLTNAVISNLETQNKSVVGALNELNSNAFLPKAELRTSADSAEPGAYRVIGEYPVDGEDEAILLCFKIFNNDWGLFTQFLIPRDSSYIKARTCWYKTWENWKKYDVGAINEVKYKDITVNDFSIGNQMISGTDKGYFSRVGSIKDYIPDYKAVISATIVSFGDCEGMVTAVLHVTQSSPAIYLLCNTKSTITNCVIRIAYI